MNEHDIRFMKRALELARKGVGLTSPNPTVGCVMFTTVKSSAKDFINTIRAITRKSSRYRPPAKRPAAPQHT
jgi:hypothetical protein